MFDWYFKDYYIENRLLLWISAIVFIIIILTTVILVYRELKREKDVNK